MEIKIKIIIKIIIKREGKCKSKKKTAFQWRCSASFVQNMREEALFEAKIKEKKKNRASTKTLLDFPFENLLAVVELVSLLTQQNGLV